MKRNIFIISAVVLALAVGMTALAALPKKGDTPSPSAPAIAPAVTRKANVAIAKIHPVQLETAIYVNGVTTAQKDITYAAKSAGRLDYMGANLGASVQKGAVLAKVDYRTQRAYQLQAQAALDLAEATHARMTKLGTEFASAQKIDETRYARDGATANLNLANANATNAIILADGWGTVAAKYAEQGEFVSPGTPLYRIVDTRTIIVEAAIAESQVKTVVNGATVTVVINALGKEMDGTVETILPKADATSKTFTVRVAIDNHDASILVGMSASLRIHSGRLNNVLIIPQDVIIEGNNERYVYVVEQGLAQKRNVALGAVEKAKVVVESGLSPNESLVVFGQRDLTDGQPVNIVRNPHVLPSI